MSEAKPKPPVFHKLRQRITEELAIQMVLDMLSPDGDMMIPAAWLSDAENLRRDLLLMLSDETASGATKKPNIR